MKDEWAAAVDALFARLVFEPVKRVVPAGSESTAFSPNAMKRNDWTPRPKVRWDVAVTLDGVDVAGVVDPEFSRGRGFKSRKAAAEDGEIMAVVLAASMKEGWAPENRGDGQAQLLGMA